MSLPVDIFFDNTRERRNDFAGRRPAEIIKTDEKTNYLEIQEIVLKVEYRVLTIFAT